MRLSIRARARAVLSGYTGLLLAACIPVDTRDPPAELRVDVQALPALSDFPLTSDGYQLRFERFLLALGRSELSGPECNAYSEGDYRRLIDFAVPSAPRKLNLLFGLGTCTFSYDVSAPGPSTVLDSSVVEADREFMRQTASDGFEEDRGISLYVRGAAHGPSGVTRFELALRSRLRFQECAPGPVLTPERTTELVLNVDATRLFLDRLDDDSSARLRFAPFAEADLAGDQDGIVTLAELTRVTLSGTAPENQAMDQFENLGEYVYRGAFPKLVSYPNGTCELRPRDD